MLATGFQPSRDGFPFRNEFDYPASRLGRAAPLAAGFGLAAGMCLAALDRWRAGRPLPVPSGIPEPGDALHEELVRRQVELLGHGAWDRILEWQSRPGIGGLVGEKGVAELTRAEWQRVRRSIERGMPALLCVVRTRGPFANPSENPIVLAYRYEYAKDTKRATIWVYDPNRPGNDDVRITVVPGGRRRGAEVTFIAERVRGFFMLPYDRPVAAPLRAVELIESSAGGFLGRGTPLPGPGARSVVRARNGGFVLVRDSKKDDAPRTQHIEGDVLGSDPIVLDGRRPTVVARAKDGTVLGFRRGVSGWRSRPLPSNKTPLQVDFGPTAVTVRGRVHAFGVRDGRLAHLQRSRAGAWTGGIVTAQTGAGASERLEGAPAVVVDRENAIRVFTRTESGRIAHMALSAEGRWVATLLPAAEAPIAGDAVATIAPDDDQVIVFAVTEEGELVQVRGGGEAWRVRNLTRETARDGGAQPVRVEIVVSDGPGKTLHVFGVSPRNALIHYWCPPTLAWRVQDLTYGRAEVGDAGRVRARPSVARTSDDQLVVAAAGERGILVYRWSAAAEWTGDPLPTPSRFAEAISPDGPLVWRDAGGRARLHAVFQDGRAIVGLPGRPDSAERLMRAEPSRATPRARPARPDRPTTTTTTDVAGAHDATDAPPEFGRAAPPTDAREPAIPEAAAAPPALVDLAGGEPVDDGGHESFAPMDLPGAELTASDDIDAADSIGLLDLGSLGGIEAETPEPDASATLDVGFGGGDVAFKPAAPLLPDPDAAIRPVELPEDLSLEAERDERARKAEEAARLQAAEEQRAKKAEQEKRAREKADAEAKKQAEVEARKKAEEEKRAREKAEAEARLEAEKAARLKAEEEERARRKVEEEKRAREKAKAEAEAKKKAEAEARRKAEEEERARKKAEEEKRARERAAAEAKQKAEAEAREKAAAEAKQKAEAEAREKAAAEEEQRAAAARAKAEKRPVPPALEGLPLLDDDAPPREPTAKPEPAEPARPKKDSAKPKPKLRSIDDLIRLSDEHDPTFEKK